MKKIENEAWVEWY